ncbi:MAG: N-acetylglucosamine-6-phosphate deacetylase [Silicimonas sp.]|nr:N-acetylglucosamine-6-phosphate deacetylase [Silicimonas sp.]
MSKRALTGAEIFDGKDLQSGKALLLDGDLVAGIVAAEAIPADYTVETMRDGTILPGFVDLQVNGGGGVMFNDETTVEGLAAIAEAHASTGTRAFMPTLITDTAKRTRTAVDAVEAAIAQSVPGIVGVHLEGPHLSVARKGAHDPTLIRRMEPNDEAFLIDAAGRLPNVMVTVAPENVTSDQIRRLSDAGIVVSLGHTDCSMAQAQKAFDAGARCVTHLFNAMSQMGNREPGLVGATLASGGVFAGLIADDIHVHAASMGIALAAKSGPGAIFLVTDAMSTVGSDITAFELNGRTVLRKDGRLTLEDGTLAGADLEMARAISVLINRVGVTRETAYAMATSAPAAVLKQPGAFGFFTPSASANAIWIDTDHQSVRGL